MKETLHDDATGKDLAPIAFETDVLLAGILAKAYSDSDCAAPIQCWAFSVPSRDLMIGNTIYRTGGMRRKINGVETAGVQLSVIEHGELKATYFFPFRALKEFSFTLEGVQVH